MPLNLHISDFVSKTYPLSRARQLAIVRHVYRGTVSFLSIMRKARVNPDRLESEMRFFKDTQAPIREDELDELDLSETVAE